MNSHEDIRGIFEAILKEPENEVVEFKEAKQGKPAEQVGKYVSALSNEANLRDKNFAWLCYGVRDKHAQGKAREVVGTSARFGEDLKQQITQGTTDGITIREIYELDVDGKRVLMLQIPAAPQGRPVAWKNTYYGRSGESLVPLSTDKYDEIRRQSGLRDWSAEINSAITLEDLDAEAISIMTERYAAKQRNDDFRLLPQEQLLNDLGLIRNGGITNAALVLIGEKEALRRLMPHAKISLEYRRSEADISYDNCISYEECFFLSLDKLWHDVNLRNNSIPIQDGPYIINIPYFNEIVIREAICNAVAHRDYRIASETIIKQYPERICIINAGGFPLGVTKENLLRVSSTPRNRLLSDVMAKTGLVERSGQGVDRIYKHTLSEGKAAPDYSQSNDFQVELTLDETIVDKAFALYVQEVQQEMHERLSVFEIIALEKICNNDSDDVPREMIQNLLRKKLIEKSGRTRGVRYFLTRRYYELAHDIPGYMEKKDEWDTSLSIPLLTVFLSQRGSAKMREIEQLFADHLSRKQVRLLVKNLMEQKIITSEGQSSGTQYSLSKQNNIPSELYLKAIKIGMEVLKNQVQGKVTESV